MRILLKIKSPKTNKKHKVKQINRKGNNHQSLKRKKVTNFLIALGPYDIDEADMTPRFVRAMQVLGYTYDDLQHKDRKAVIDIIKIRGSFLLIIRSSR